MGLTILVTYFERFKNGAFKIAKKTGVTIVPIYLHNVHRVFEGNGHWLGHPENVTVNILDTIDKALELTDKQETKQYDFMKFLVNIYLKAQKDYLN